MLNNLAKLALAILIIVGGLAIVTVGSKGPPITNKHKTKIGISLPLSGEAAVYGREMQVVYNFANERLADNSYQLVFEDDKCSAKEAITVAQKLIDYDQVNYITGFACSGALLAAAPLYERAHKLVVSAATSAPEVSDAGDFIFRVWPSDALAAPVLLKPLVNKYKNAALLSEETAYCQGFVGALKEQASVFNISIIEETFLPNTMDFRSHLLRLKVKNPEALIAINQTELSLAELVKQLKAMQWNIPIFSAYNPAGNSFLNAVGDQANGIVFVDSPNASDLLNEKGKTFFRDFNQRYGQFSGAPVYSYTALISFIALHQAIASKDEPRHHLYHNLINNDYVQPFRFDENGDIVGTSHVLKIIRDRSPILLPQDN